MAAHLSIVLDTTRPLTPTVTFTNGNVLSVDTNFNQIPITITKDSSDTDVTEMLIYGGKGVTSRTFTGDGTTTTFTYANDATEVVEFSSVKVNGTTYSGDVTTSTLGQITFDVAPSDGDSIEIFFVKKVLTANDASWIPFSSSADVAFDKTTVETAGTATIYVLIRDEVYNECATAGSATATVDTSIPEVTITNVVLGNGYTLPSETYKISKVAGRDTIHITFTVTEAIQAWKAMLVSDPADGESAVTNVQIPQTAGSTTQASSVSIAADTPTTCTIKGADLETAAGGTGNDGTYTVKIFAQDTSGNWSA